MVDAAGLMGRPGLLGRAVAADNLAMKTAPPDAERVARRAIILSAIVCRSNSDHDRANPDAIDRWTRLQTWIETQDVGCEIEPAEEEIIYAPLGRLDEKTAIRSTWQAEGLAILAWALGRFPFPKHDQKVDPYELTDSLMFLDDDAGTVINDAKLRPPDELNACRELYYAVHCRLRVFQGHREARNIAHWFEPKWLDALAIDFPLGPTGDIRIGDVEIIAAAEKSVMECEWAVYERHRAAIWLTDGDEPLYSRVPVDT